MTDEATLEMLQKEFDRVQAKAAATDAAFVNFLSIGVVPFFVFIAYVLANPQYRIFLVALPYITLLGLAVVLVLATHYRYVGAYASYLQRRMNMMTLVSLRDRQFSRACYHGWLSPVAVSYAMAFLALIALNLVAKPMIAAIICEALRVRSKLPPETVTLLKNYWPITYWTVAASMVTMFIPVMLVGRRLKRLR